MDQIDLGPVLETVFEEVGLVLFKKGLEVKWTGVRAEYSSILANDWQLAIWVEGALLDVEVYDLRYPPNQGALEGGYTVSPWISGASFDLHKPDSLDDLKRFIVDPAKFLKIDRACAFGDKSHALHDGEFPEQCYHEEK